MTHDHFEGKETLTHVAERLAEGTLSSMEAHGLEVPGHINAAVDSSRDTALCILLLFSVLTHLNFDNLTLIKALILFLLGFILWKAGRAAWLGWSRLERLHRLLAQEKWEIEHNRPQEREELLALYGAKGFEGRLLEEVVDVLMADEARLLKVMIEEEMGLSLENTEHPLKQGLGAFLGALFASSVTLGAIYFFPVWGSLIGALTVIAISSYIIAKRSLNREIPAIVWNVGLAILAWGVTHYVAELL